MTTVLTLYTDVTVSAMQVCLFLGCVHGCSKLSSNSMLSKVKSVKASIERDSTRRFVQRRVELLSQRSYTAARTGDSVVSSRPSCTSRRRRPRSPAPVQQRPRQPLNIQLTP
ncbi:hypothetical protein K474DRAFT_1093980 [Panus rudis PR-1116 ss-1]|nr:hypothetical protein K474DRAFT_1093980 [Panus rudis PR-1116 ss-1]